jgi:hypothetical protein
MNDAEFLATSRRAVPRAAAMQADDSRLSEAPDGLFEIEGPEERSSVSKTPDANAWLDSRLNIDIRRQVQKIYRLLFHLAISLVLQDDARRIIPQ